MRRLGLVAGGGIVAAAAIGLARSALLVVRVDGESMIPAYWPGDVVLAARRWLTGTARRGDVVICRLPPQVPGPGEYPLLKRVTSVASGRVVVRGDGPFSYDSRAFGPVPEDCVLGRVVVRLTPLHGASRLDRGADRTVAAGAPAAGGP